MLAAFASWCALHTLRDRLRCRYAASADPFYPVEYEGVTFDSFPLKVIFERDKTGFEESKEFPIKVHSVVAGRYQILEYLGSAACALAAESCRLAGFKSSSGKGSWGSPRNYFGLVGSRAR